VRAQSQVLQFSLSFYLDPPFSDWTQMHIQ
jgi:hypothetical protein